MGATCAVTCTFLFNRELETIVGMENSKIRIAASSQVRKREMQLGKDHRGPRLDLEYFMS